MFGIGGHLGASVSALVDGQLDEESAERAWQHVAHCPGCRGLVEREGWVKRRLASMAEPAAQRPPEELLGSLYGLDHAAEAWSAVEEIEARGRFRRRAGIALVGAGSVSAAVLGLTALGGAGLGAAPTGTPAASLTRAGSSAAPTRAVVAPVATVHGRLRGWSTHGGSPDVAHVVAVDARQ